MIVNHSLSNFHHSFIFIVTALTVLLSPLLGEESCNNELSDQQRESSINEWLDAFKKQMEEEFNLVIRKDMTWRSHSISFYAHRRATIEEARVLILSVLNRLEKKTREDSKLLYFLRSIPASIDVDIHFVNSKKYAFNDGSVDYVSSFADSDRPTKLRYSLPNPFEEYFGYTNLEESLEEAVELASRTPVINPAIHVLTRFEEEIDQILESFKKEINEKHGLLNLYSGWMIDGKSSSELLGIRARCTYFYPVEKQEARELILQASEVLIRKINDSETLRPYLVEYPFSSNQLKLRILFRKLKYFVGDVLYDDGSLESVEIDGGIINYYSGASGKERVVYSKEAYTEAQKILANTPPPTIPKKINDFVVIFSKLSEFIVFAFAAILFMILGLSGATNTNFEPWFWLLIVSAVGCWLLFLWGKRRLLRRK